MVIFLLAERERFELSEPFGSTVFKTVTLNHSVTSPIIRTQEYYQK